MRTNQSSLEKSPVVCRVLCDPATFSEVYDQFAEKLYRYAFLRLSSKEDAEDVLSTTFLKFWDYLNKNTTRTLSNIPAFLYRIARNLIIDQYRARTPTLSVELLFEQGFELPAHADGVSIMKKAEYELVIGALSKLSDDDRDVLLLRFIDGLPVVDIAELYSITENNTSVRIHRALGRLKEIMHTNV